MSTSLEPDGMRIRVELIPNIQQSELSVWSYYTGKRDPAQYATLSSVVATHVQNLAAAGGVSLISDWVTATVYLDLWNEPLLAVDGWGTAHQEPIARTAPATNNLLPPQCAIVVSRDTDDSELPQRRARNRSYLGPIIPANLLDDGTLDPTTQTDLLAEMEAFDLNLATAPVAGSTPPEYVGLCNVSYKGTTTPGDIAQIAKTDRIRVGNIVDTQRSRRNGLPESYLVGVLP